MADQPEPASIDEHSVVRRRRDVGTVALDRDAVLVDPPAGRAHALNPSGALVWQCLDGDETLQALIDDLADAFGADRATVAADVVALARDLARLGLLDGFAADTGAWPAGFAPDHAGECAPDDDRVAAFDDRYLAAPPNR